MSAAAHARRPLRPTPHARSRAAGVPAPRVCQQQESRSVSTARAGPGPQTAPDAYTFVDGSPLPVPTASSTSSTQWSRPIRTDVCSMFARMPRYAPASSGIRSAARMRATGQNGSSRHVLALFDSSSRRINEQSSGLLIRGFGVQVPGGAPGLTWGFRLQVVLLSGLVGPWWVQCGTSSRSAELSFLSLGMLKARLSRRVGVVRVLGSFGQGGATRRHRRVPGVPDGQAVISASTGALRLVPPPAGCPLSAPGARLRRRLQAQLDGDAEVGVGGQHRAGVAELVRRLQLSAPSSISVAAPCRRSCGGNGVVSTGRKCWSGNPARVPRG